MSAKNQPLEQNSGTPRKIRVGSLVHKGPKYSNKSFNIATKSALPESKAKPIMVLQHPANIKNTNQATSERAKATGLLHAAHRTFSKVVHTFRNAPFAALCATMVMVSTFAVPAYAASLLQSREGMGTGLAKRTDGQVGELSSNLSTLSKLQLSGGLVFIATNIWIF